jgi:trimeric autotransporter adhesin
LTTKLNRKGLSNTIRVLMSTIKYCGLFQPFIKNDNLCHNSLILSLKSIIAMKIKTIILATLGLLLASSLLSFGQSTTILPGEILPQMTTIQRTGLSNPNNGTLVFDKDTKSYWYVKDGNWIELPSNNFWQLNGINGNEIANTNSGGFWSSNPTTVSSSMPSPFTAPATGAGTRLMWIPSRSAFRVGTVTTTEWDASNIGLFSFASGYNTRAADLGTALGYYTQASYNGTATGYYTNASGVSSTAMGGATVASGNFSVAIGYASNATESFSTSIGHNNVSSGRFSTSIGASARAQSYASTAIGDSVTAGAIYATAMGYNTKALGSYSTTMGHSAVATGNYAVSIGYFSKATNSNDWAAGYYTEATGGISTAFGGSTKATGNVSTSMGYGTVASGNISTAMGWYTQASGQYTTAMGNSTVASGQYSTAMGYKVNTNLKKGSFAIGDSDPFSQGVTNSNNENEFLARFANGYYFLTSGNTSPTGIIASAGSNSWSAISDSSRKERLKPINGESILQKIANFKLTTWNYKGQDPRKFRHYGPMAQEFFHAFGHDEVGTIGCDTLINQQDFLGVNFAAIQALEYRTTELQNKNKELQLKNDLLEKEMQEMRVLKSRIERLEALLEEKEISIRKEP